MKNGKEENILVLYHGSSVIVEQPRFGIGRADNDYGSGFYTTGIKERAEVIHFLNQRRVAIARRFLVPEITVVDAITCQYVYHKDGEYYEKRESS